MEIDFQSGRSGDGDAGVTSLRGLFGTNFADGRGNIVIAAQYDQRDGVRQGDRDFTSGDGLYDNDTNPALRFQTGDITSDATPNFSQYYNFDNTGLFPVGLNIPDQATFESDFAAEFGTAPTLTQAELDLIDRAANAPAQAILRGGPSTLRGRTELLLLVTLVLARHRSDRSRILTATVRRTVWTPLRATTHLSLARDPLALLVAAGRLDPMAAFLPIRTASSQTTSTSWRVPELHRTQPTFHYS